MMFIESVSYPAALAAGLLSFFSPCILPLIPSYFSFICGYSVEELTEGRSLSLRSRVFTSTVLFVFGFSLVFVLLGASASALGNLLDAYKGPLRIIGGLVVLLLGFHLLGVFRIPGLDVEKRLHMEKKPLRMFGALLIGMAFAAGWSPCIGPLLGAILVMAGNQETVRQGITLLAVFSLGMATPFLLMALFIGSLLRFLGKTKNLLRYLNPVSGLVLTVIGMLLITDNLNLLASYLLEII